MLKKYSNFIVRKKNLVLILMLVLTAVCALLWMRVDVNKDLTKYLPDDSPMKIGMDLMAEEFPDMETPNTIRVMFDGLTDGQKETVLAQLRTIPHVDSVDYDAESSSYHRDGHTLFVLNMSCEYGSREERAIESALEERFDQYTLTWKNDDSGTYQLPLIAVTAALIVIIIILFLMCRSWVEPILFLVVIGAAIVINLGTNLIIGSISNVTYSIAALLQLVLSMDYSIILVNRYRQEKQSITEPKQAMASAMIHAFSSIVSSSLTTVVGLLMLSFMSFKIGMNLGFVLAKGVFISMICVLTILPGLILLFDKLIEKTAKKSLHIPMNWAAKFSHKARFAMPVLFVLLFAGAFLLQRNTGITYTLVQEDPIAEVFPKSNALVMVYDNRDETQVSRLAALLEEDDNVQSVMGYGSTLGKGYTSSELAEQLDDLDGELPLDPRVIDLLYYDYFAGDKTSTMTAAEFLQFLSDTLAGDNTFSQYLDDEILDHMDLIKKFADPSALTAPMTAEELAAFFQMDAGEMKELFLFYTMQHGGVPGNSMTLDSFVNFVVNEVAADPDYSAMFEADALAQLARLSTFTDREKMTALYHYQDIAALLGMEEDQAKLLFLYYQALSPQYDPGTMTLPEFVAFLQTDVMHDPNFAPSIDANTAAQLGTLAQYTQKDAVQAQRTPAELAAMLGMDEAMVRTIFILHNAGDVSGSTMTLPQFTGFVSATLMNDPLFAPSFDPAAKAQLQTTDGLIRLASSGQALTAGELAARTGMAESEVSAIFGYRSQTTGTQVTVMTLPEFCSVAAALAPGDPQVQQMDQMVQLAVSGTELDGAALSKLFGMEESMVTLIFRLYHGGEISEKTLSLEETVDFILADPVMRGYPDESALPQLQMMQQLIKATTRETLFTAPELAAVMGMDSSTVRLVYTLRAAERHGDSWRLSPQTVIDFLLEHSQVFASAMDAETLGQLSTAQGIIHGSVAGHTYTAGQLAELVGMDQTQAEQLYLLYTSRHGDTSGWTLSVQAFLQFILHDVLPRQDLSAAFDTETAELLTAAHKLVDAVVSGKSYTPTDMSALLEGLTHRTDSAAMELLYLYKESGAHRDPTWTMSLESLLDHLADHVLDDPRFVPVIDEEMRSTLLEARKELDEGKEQLVTERHSRLVITSSYPDESPETTAFLTGIEEYGRDHLTGDFYLIGNAAMTHEMQNTFGRERLFITLLTALAIFLIVALTFRSLSVPLILVLIVQCGVYITVIVTGLISGSMYYLALLMVECILMGATIDYGILLTSYYREARRTRDVLNALKVAYAGSIHTIMTSGLILVLVTAIVGRLFQEPTIIAIVRTISVGSFCALVLILFILPGVLAACDKLVVKKKDRAPSSKEQ